MRKTKFRLRNATTKEIVAYELIGIPYNCGYAFYFTNDKEQTYHSNSNELVRACGVLCPIREQFTGLQDVNGKDIYEGDVCKIESEDSKTRISQVIFENGCFNLQFNLLKNGLYHFTENYSLYVIGNIYENPELIEASK